MTSHLLLLQHGPQPHTTLDGLPPPELIALRPRPNRKPGQPLRAVSLLCVPPHWHAKQRRKEDNKVEEAPEEDKEEDVVTLFLIHGGTSSDSTHPQPNPPTHPPTHPTP